VWEAFLIRLFDSAIDEYDSFARGIVNLSMRPWVSRVWVVQEVALASKSPIILAGTAWSYLDSLDTLTAIIMAYPRRSLKGMPDSTAVLQLSLLPLTRRSYQGFEDNEGTFDIDSSSSAARLNEILGFTLGNYRATLPHDYIYGLLGLVGIQTLPSVLTPDYNKPYPQVCREYARFIFENTRDLTILLRSHSEISGVPTWVPGFRSDYRPQKGIDTNLSPVSFSDDGNRMTILAL
jgi:hypothetical protein